MRLKSYRFLVVFAAVFILSHSAFAAIPDPFLEGKVHAIENQIIGWEHEASIIRNLTFAVIALGIIIAALQTVKPVWVKILVAVLSVSTSLIAAYTGVYYSADHRAFERLSKFAQYKVGDFRDEVEPVPHPDDTLLKVFRDKLSKIKGEIARFEEETLKNLVPSTPTTMLSWPGISSAFAADEAPSAMRAPEWLKNPPRDDRNLYFVGVAEGTSVEAARTNALESARSIAAKTIESAARKSQQLNAKEEYIADFTQAVASPAEVVNTFVTPNAQSGTYRASALLRLPRSVAAFNAETFFVDKGLPYDQTLLRGIESNTSALAAVAQQATQVQRTAVNSGLVYIHIPREEDRPVAEALRQNLSKIFSAPGVEKAAPPATSNVVRYFRPEDSKLADAVKTAAETFLSQEGYKTNLALENLSGTTVTGTPQQIEIWLGPISTLKPRVYLEVEQGTSTATVDKVKSALESKGFAVPKVEQVTGVRSGESRVFYYKTSDAQKADALAQALPELGIQNSRESATKITGPADAQPGHFDLRVGKDSFRKSDEGPR